MIPSALLSALVATVPTFWIPWMASGSWTPAHASWPSVVLMLPMIFTLKLGIDQGKALLATYCFYRLNAFAIIARYTYSMKLRTQPFKG